MAHSSLNYTQPSKAIKSSMAVSPLPSDHADAVYADGRCLVTTASTPLVCSHMGTHLQGTDEQQVAGDNFRAIRPTYNHKLNWTAGHSAFELSLSDADSSPCEALVAAWEQADEQKWKIVPAADPPPSLVKLSMEQQQRMYSIRVRRRDARFGLSLEEGRLALRLVLPASPQQVWKVCVVHLPQACCASVRP